MLPYTQYLEECASSLAADPQDPSDPLLVHVVSSMHLASQASTAFEHGSGEKVFEGDDDKLQILVKALVKKADDWKALLPHGSLDSGQSWSASAHAENC